MGQLVQLYRAGTPGRTFAYVPSMHRLGVGALVGSSVGTCVGSSVGSSVGNNVGTTLGSGDGNLVYISAIMEFDHGTATVVLRLADKVDENEVLFSELSTVLANSELVKLLSVAIVHVVNQL